jgi:hypothetical protein
MQDNMNVVVSLLKSWYHSFEQKSPLFGDLLVRENDIQILDVLGIPCPRANTVSDVQAMSDSFQPSI